MIVHYCRSEEREKHTQTNVMLYMCARSRLRTYALKGSENFLSRFQTYVHTQSSSCLLQTKSQSLNLSLLCSPYWYRVCSRTAVLKAQFHDVREPNLGSIS